MKLAHIEMSLDADSTHGCTQYEYSARGTVTIIKVILAADAENLLND